MSRSDWDSWHNRMGMQVALHILGRRCPGRLIVKCDEYVHSDVVVRDFDDLRVIGSLWSLIVDGLTVIRNYDVRVRSDVFVWDVNVIGNLKEL